METDAAGSARAAPAARRERFGGSRELAAHEADDFLRTSSWGVLATVEEGRPYAVPVVYGYDGAVVYVACRPGRKVRNLEAVPAACLTVVRVEEGGARWRSVVVRGAVDWVTDPVRRLRALAALRRQRGLPLPLGLDDVAALAGARVLRLVPDEVTGRSRGDVDPC